MVASFAPSSAALWFSSPVPRVDRDDIVANAGPAHDPPIASMQQKQTPFRRDHPSKWTNGFFATVFNLNWRSAASCISFMRMSSRARSQGTTPIPLDGIYVRLLPESSSAAAGKEPELL
ncbi:hypothetical protein VTN31DRAFT_6858 [Thermomyces dupontii]|uniref:uncharacterized protein n=1 Tax=Talaromyces thermophilus TaxID=28565 RepID=UPI003744059F